uniref:Uncharacterized protein n=1 Tax=Glossina pallidipes TaxID=7398 RepID=A0A1A9Z3X9_GLOPL
MRRPLLSYKICEDLVFELRSRVEPATVELLSLAVVGVNVSLDSVGRFLPPVFAVDLPLQVFVTSRPAVTNGADPLFFFTDAGRPVRECKSCKLPVELQLLLSTLRLRCGVTSGENVMGKDFGPLLHASNAADFFRISMRRRGLGDIERRAKFGETELGCSLSITLSPVSQHDQQISLRSRAENFDKEKVAEMSLTVNIEGGTNASVYLIRKLDKEDILAAIPSISTAYYERCKVYQSSCLCCSTRLELWPKPHGLPLKY